MEVRALRADEPGLQRALGDITVAAYREPYPEIDQDGYAAELADVAGRVAAAVVLVALEGDRVLGGVTYVPDSSNPLAEVDVPDTASMRMLAVDPAAQGRGAGEALVRACVRRATEGGRRELVLHSTTAMTAAHRLYERLGFVRDEALDWWPEPDFLLMGFRLPLR
jgi:ribosomal protein S18 acetylase RimI-like enzyme